MTVVEHGPARQAGPEPIAVAPPRGWVRRLWDYLLLHHSDVTISMIAAILGSVCLAVVPLIERQIVNSAILDRRSALWTWLTLLLAIAAVAFVFSYLRRYHGAKVALAVQLDLACAENSSVQVRGMMPVGPWLVRGGVALYSRGTPAARRSSRHDARLCCCDWPT